MQFRLGSIPVRIQGYFFLMAALLAASERDPARMAVWVAVVLVSVLVHELGHALVGRAFGLAPAIALHGMGGTTSFTPLAGRAGRPLGTLRNVLISIAGPFAGFALAAATLAAESQGLGASSAVAQQVLKLFVYVNVYWGIFNLLPMYPLDGGNVLRHVASRLSLRHGERAAHVISLLVAVALALHGLANQEWWRVYLGALFGYYNVQALRRR